MVRLLDQINGQHGLHRDILHSNADHGKRITDIVVLLLEEVDKMYVVNLRASFLLSQAMCTVHGRSETGRNLF